MRDGDRTREFCNASAHNVDCGAESWNSPGRRDRPVDDEVLTVTALANALVVSEAANLSAPAPSSASPIAAPALPHKRFRPEHGLFASAASFLLVAAGGWNTSRELGSQLGDARRSLDDMKITLTKIEAQGSARDAAMERLSNELADAVKELRDLERARERAGEQIREHERRLGTIEGKRQ